MEYNLYIEDLYKNEFLSMISEMFKNMDSFLDYKEVKKILEEKFKKEVPIDKDFLLIQGFDDNSSKFSLSTSFYTEGDSYTEEVMKIKLDYFLIEVVKNSYTLKEDIIVKLSFRNGICEVFSANFNNTVMNIKKDDKKEKNEAAEFFFEDIKNGSFTANTFHFISCVTDTNYIPQNAKIELIVEEYNTYIKPIFNEFATKKELNKKINLKRNHK